MQGQWMMLLPCPTKQTILISESSNKKIEKKRTTTTTMKRKTYKEGLKKKAVYIQLQQ